MSERLGIFFDLKDSDYFADAALGSTDIKRLMKSASDYWWNSPHNPLKPEDDPTTAQFFGRAVHRFVLDGERAFLAEYAATEFPGNIKAGKEERREIEAAGKTPVKRDDFNRIVLSAQMIRANPHLSEAFSGGRSEVSVFWKSEDGIRLKSRFDYLKVRAIADLKTVRNTRQQDFVEACRASLANNLYEVQAKHYFDGRAAFRDLWRDGLVYGDHDADWLKSVANSQEYAFVFVFWQATSAPITWAGSLSPGNPILEVAARDISMALDRYREFSARFGMDEPWILAEPVREISADDLPRWSRVNRAA